jgi:hypothetical protein
MPIRVQLPDGNIGEFPDGMKPGEIEAVLRKQFPPQTQARPDSPQQLAASSQGDPSGFFDSFVAAINPVPAIQEWWNRPNARKQAADVIAITRQAAMRNPANRGKPPAQWKDVQLTPEEQIIVDRASGSPSPEGNILAEFAAVPVTIGRQAKQGDLAGAAGTLAGAVVPAVALPYAVKGARAAAEKAMRGGSRRIMQSALKPGAADARSLSDVQTVVDQALVDRIPVTQEGLFNLSKLIEDLSRKIQGAVDERAAAGAAIEPRAILQRLDDYAGEVKRQVNPQPDLKQIEAIRRNFEANTGQVPSSTSAIVDAYGRPISTPARPAQPIPIDQAQGMKQGTYRQLDGKYGATQGASVEAEKALARGIKEEIERLAPEVKELNATEGARLQLQDVIERRIRQVGNSEIVGLGDGVAGAAGMVAAGPGGGLILGAIKKLLDAPGVKSKLAIAIADGAKKAGRPMNMNQAMARVAAVIAGASASRDDHNIKVDLGQ